MQLVAISKEEFPLWNQFRMSLYKDMDEEYNDKEMESIHLDNKWHCQFIENNKGDKIGLIELSIRNIVDGCLSSPVPYLEGFYLIENERSQGLGSKIIQLLLSWCKAQGYTEFATDTELTNQRAQSFYERIGFEEVDRVVMYKIEIDKQ